MQNNALRAASLNEHERVGGYFLDLGFPFLAPLRRQGDAFLPTAISRTGNRIHGACPSSCEE